MRLIFIHGWGMNGDVWREILPAFEDYDCRVLDLGFYGAPDMDVPEDDEPSIVITHSYGGLWALGRQWKNLKGFVSINGFVCFRDFAPPEIIRTMQEGLTKNPNVQLRSFLRQINADMAGGDVDLDALYKGLDDHANVNRRENLKAFNCPVLALSGENDPLLSPAKMRKHWQDYDLRIHEKAAHILPIEEAQWCVEQIKEFMVARELEN